MQGRKDDGNVFLVLLPGAGSNPKPRPTAPLERKVWVAQTVASWNHVAWLQEMCYSVWIDWTPGNYGGRPAWELPPLIGQWDSDLRQVD